MVDFDLNDIKPKRCFMCGCLTKVLTPLFRLAEGFTDWYTEEEWGKIDTYKDLSFEIGWFCDTCIDII